MRNPSDTTHTEPERGASEPDPPSDRTFPRAHPQHRPPAPAVDRDRRQAARLPRAARRTPGRAALSAMSSRPDFKPAEIFPIDDLETLQLIMTEPRIALIELLRNPSSVAQLAESLDVPRTRLYHHINALEEVGAIVVVDERRAGALNEKIYQVAARTFQPSKKFLESATPREQAIAIIDSLFSITRADLVRAVEQGQISLSDSEQKRSMTIARHMLTLTPERRAELVERLQSLLHEFEDDETDETEPFGLLIIGHPSSRRTT